MDGFVVLYVLLVFDSIKEFGNFNEADGFDKGVPVLVRADREQASNSAGQVCLHLRDHVAVGITDIVSCSSYPDCPIYVGPLLVVFFTIAHFLP